MNIKSITTLGLVAVALAVTSVAPAFANNNNAYMNQLAMQMYMQNQAAAPTNPWLNGTIPVSYQAPVYGAATNPWAAYSVPYTNVISPQVVYRNVAVPHFVGHEGFRDRFHR
jgi:hypothetical protein